MNIGGWICMITAVTFVSTLFFFCCWKIMSNKSSDDNSDIVGNSDTLDNSDNSTGNN